MLAATQNLSEPLVHVFEKANCQGNMHIIQRWTTKLNNEHIEMDHIESLIIPPHASIHLYRGTDGTFQLFGPKILNHTSFDLGRWHHLDGSACQPTDSWCNKKVDWNFNVVGQDPTTIQANRTISWLEYVHHHAVQNIPTLRFGSKSYPIDHDNNFQWWCHPKSGFAPHPSIDCSCFNAMKEFKLRFGDSVTEQIHVDMLRSFGCHGENQYIPQAYPRQNTSATLEECSYAMFHMINSENIQTAAEKNSFQCGTFSFPNLNDSENRTMKEVDSLQINNREVREMQNHEQNKHHQQLLFWSGIGIMCFIVAVCACWFAFHYFRRTNPNVRQWMKDENGHPFWFRSRPANH